MRSAWSNIPMLRILLAFMAGVGAEIWLDSVFDFSAKGAVAMLVFFLIAIFIIFISSHIVEIRKQFRWRPFIGLALHLSILSVGYLWAWLYVQKNHYSHFARYVSKHDAVQVYIAEPPVVRDKIITCVANVESVSNKDWGIATTGKLLVNLSRNAKSEHLKYGDRLVFAAPIEVFREPQNPGEFSFKLFQSFRNVFNRVYLKEDNWQLLTQNNGNVFLTHIYNLRSHLLGVMMRAVDADRELAVGSAILLGFRDYMNGEIVQAYSSSGALHVLSVSGLHVGIVYMMLHWLLSWMEKRGRKWRILQVTIMVAAIWLYAVITGLSPSVLRAAAMFSLLSGGRLFNRHINTYNIIAASALLLMLFNPFIITELGFRLSYLAVLGIIFIQPLIYKKLVFRNKIMDGIWGITAVSIAAQIATFPIGLYYFHQFPNYFLASNLIVIPVSNLILFSGMALFALYNVPFANTAISFVFKWLLKGLNEFVYGIQQLPYSLTEGISITMVEMWLMYLLILLLCALTLVRRKELLYGALMSVLVLAGMHTWKLVERQRQNFLIVYSAPPYTAIAHIYGNEAKIIFDQRLLQNKSAMLFHVTHHWWQCGITKTENLQEETSLPFGKLYNIQGRKFLLADSATILPKHWDHKPLQVDYMVITNSIKISPQKLLAVVNPSEIIFDTGNKTYYHKKWRKAIAEKRIPYTNVSDTGARIISL